MMPSNTKSPYLPEAMAIASAVREFAHVFTLSFQPSAGFCFRPGQFNMLYVHGIGEVAISISGDSAEQARLTHTIRAVGTTTRALEALNEGDVLGIRGPYGSAWPLDEARGRDVLFIAGGIGLAPLRPAILHVLRRRSEYGRVTILYGARSPEELLFREQLAHWRGRFDVRLEAIVDRASNDWFGHVGVVTRLLDDVPLDPDNAVFMCGPEVMMRFVARELERHGLPGDSIWVSLERSMKCGVGLCGHCQFGGSFVCKDGPVYRFDKVAPLLDVKEV